MYLCRSHVLLLLQLLPSHPRYVGADSWFQPCVGQVGCQDGSSSSKDGSSSSRSSACGSSDGVDEEEEGGAGAKGLRLGVLTLSWTSSRMPGGFQSTGALRAVMHRV